MSCSHATELSICQPPIDKLDFLVGELKRWAELNPGLRPLHAEFITVARELRDGVQAEQREDTL